MAELRAIDDAWPELPTEQDEHVVIPPAKRGYVRRVPGTACAIWYSFDDGGVLVHAAKLLG